MSTNLKLLQALCWLSFSYRKAPYLNLSIEKERRVDRSAYLRYTELVPGNIVCIVAVFLEAYFALQAGQYIENLLLESMIGTIVVRE